MIKKRINSKEAVFQKEQNPFMPGGMVFLSFLVSSDYFNWKDLFLSAAVGEEHVSAKLWLSSTLALLLLAAYAEPTYLPTYLTHETSNF